MSKRIPLVWSVLLALLLAGCGWLSPMVPPVGSQLIFKLEQEPGVQGATSAQLWVRLANEGYRTAAMPGSWDTAVVTLSGGNLGGPQAKTIAKTSFDGSNQTTASYTGLRPGSGYALNVKLYTGGAGGTLQAEGTQSPLTLVAGSQAVTVTLALSAPPGDVSLRGIQPAVASAGQTLVLEGHGFQGGAAVNFPGAGAVAATVLGANRLSVTVPAGATAGNLTVTSGGTTTNAQAFRKVSYALGLQRFNAHQDPPIPARQLPSMTTARRGMASAVIGNYLYQIGGNGPLNSVERATIQADGSLGPFSLVAGVTLVTARGYHNCAVVGDHLYVFGGTDGSTLNSVERASINADGTISTFSTVPGVSLATARWAFTSQVIGSYLYLFGGTEDGSSGLSSVERATIGADGTISTFSTVSGVSLDDARAYPSSEVVGTYLYVIGGSSDGDTMASVERATISADGAISDLATVGGVGLATDRDSHCSVVLGNYLYVLGGYQTGSGFIDTVERATINANGTISTFSTVGGIALGTERADATCEIIGNYLYVTGGTQDGGSDLVSLERARIDASGNLGTFATVGGVGLATARSHSGTAVIGNYLYVVGGFNGSHLASVERATLNADGTLGNFAIVGGVSLATARANFVTAVLGNYLYVVGGWGASSQLASVERATINADGSISTFSAVGGVALTGPRGFFSGAVIGNYLYVFGGYNGSSMSSVERATINADGSISNFSTVGGVSLATTRDSYAIAITGNYIYLVGGYSWDAPLVSLGSVERATINADGSISSFAMVPGVNLATARESHSGMVIGGHLYVYGGLYYESDGEGYDQTDYLSSVERATINADGSISNFSTVGGVALVNARSSLVSVAIGNFLYTIGGTNGGFLGTVERALLQ